MRFWLSLDIVANFKGDALDLSRDLFKIDKPLKLCLGLHQSWKDGVGVYIIKTFGIVGWRVVPGVVERIIKDAVKKERMEALEIKTAISKSKGKVGTEYIPALMA